MIRSAESGYAGEHERKWRQGINSNVFHRPGPVYTKHSLCFFFEIL